jgi:hypothetical protein
VLPTPYFPGTGPIRRRKAKVMPAGPSQGFADADVSLNEQIAIHYNCACCHARLEDPQAGLVSLVRSMEAGYDDYDNVRVGLALHSRVSHWPC